MEWYDTNQFVTDGSNKTEIKRLEQIKAEEEQRERSRLNESEKQRRMNIATHRLHLKRNFEF